MDPITLAAAKSYVKQTANSLGAVKGAPCTIKSITESDDGVTIVFSWTGADGTEQTSTAFLPRGPQGEPGEKGEPGEPGKDGSGVDEEARKQIAELTEEKGNVKTVNGIEPDASGNVNLQVTEAFESTGQHVSVDGLKEGSAIHLVSNGDAVTWDRNYVAVHCGENLLDCSEMPENHSVPVTYDGDGWITFELASAETAVKWINGFLKFPWLNASEKYRCYFELSAETSVTGTVQLNSFNNNDDHYFSTQIAKFSDWSTPGVYSCVVETKADGLWAAMYILKFAMAFPIGAYGKIKMRPWMVKVDNSTPVSTAFTLTQNASYPGYFGEKYALTVPANQAIAQDWGNIAAYEGVNTFAATHGEVTASGEKTVEYASGGAAKLDVTQYNIPIVFMTGSTAGMSKDNAVTLDYKYNGMTGTCTLKWQGSSSLAHPKKNYTIKFDTAFEAKDGWGAQKKYVLKANYMDHTHARNICSCKLWGEIVKSRANVPAELSSLPNGGAIDGFPCIVMLNNEFHGLYTFNIPKDGWMFGSPKAILCADAHVDATKFKALATLDGDYELEYVENEDNADWVLSSINTAIQAVMDSDGNDLDTVVSRYIDIPSAIDYYIHTVDEGGLDGTDHNYLLVTYDGVKWYFGAYDRDRTYGIGWNDDDFISPVGVLTFAEFADIHRLMGLIKANKAAEMKARAIELRDGVKSEANVYTVFVNFMQAIPTQILDEDVRLYPGIPSTNVHNLAQILNWYRMRRIAVDAEIDAM